MKNNTKLIIETWRKFLNEGPENAHGQDRDPDDKFTESESWK